MYVAPNDLDCSVGSFLGVWDIERKMKVAFLEDKDDVVIDHKCKELFSEEGSYETQSNRLICCLPFEWEKAQWMLGING